MRSYGGGRIDHFSVQPTSAEVVSSCLHPLCILLVEDMSETALASRLRYVYERTRGELAEGDARDASPLRDGSCGL